MAEDDIPTLKLSEVSRMCGIEVDVLRRLVDDRQLPGVVRGKGGHVYVYADAVPTWHQAVDLLQSQLRDHLHRSKELLGRVRVEIEAVANDIDMAIEDPLAELGDDLTALRSYSRNDHTTLSSALFRLERETWAVKAYSDALRRARAAR